MAEFLQALSLALIGVSAALAAGLLLLGILKGRQLTSDNARIELAMQWGKLKTGIILGVLAMLCFLLAETFELAEDFLHIELPAGLFEYTIPFIFLFMASALAMNAYVISKMAGAK